MVARTPRGGVKDVWSSSQDFLADQAARSAAVVHPWFLEWLVITVVCRPCFSLLSASLACVGFISIVRVWIQGLDLYSLVEDLVEKVTHNLLRLVPVPHTHTHTNTHLYIYRPP